jgi:hypothetical protein
LKISKSVIVKTALLFILVGLVLPWEASLLLVLPAIVLWKFIIPKKPAPFSIGSFIIYWIVLSVWLAVIYQFL